MTPVMEDRPNSGPEQKPYDIGHDSHNFPLSEYLTTQRATILWDGPRHASYKSKTARLIYVNWPHGMNPSPESLSIADLFYTGKMKELCKSLPLYYYHSLLRNYSVLQVGVI